MIRQETLVATQHATRSSTRFLLACSARRGRFLTVLLAICTGASVVLRIASALTTAVTILFIIVAETLRGSLRSGSGMEGSAEADVAVEQGGGRSRGDVTRATEWFR